MGSIWSCLQLEDFQEHGRRSDSVFRNCVCVRCLVQQFFHVYTALFLRDEVHTVSPVQGFTSIEPVIDNSIPDTFRPPPRPIPYDDPRCSRLQQDGLVLRRDKSSSHFHDESEPLRSSSNQIAEEMMETKCRSDYEDKSKICHPESSLHHPALEVTKETTYIFPSSEDDDVCPTCLEEYTTEDPRITMQCSHHFHLGCIYEWMERSEACPVCGKTMVFNERT